MLPINFGFGEGEALTGTENLLGGLAPVDLSFPEKLRPTTLLLTLGVLNPLKMKVFFYNKFKFHSSYKSQLSCCLEKRGQTAKRVRTVIISEVGRKKFWEFKLHTNYDTKY